MSETVIFVVGSIVFALTVYGAVIAGGLAMSRAQVEQNSRLKDNADARELEKRFPTRMKF